MLDKRNTVGAWNMCGVIVLFVFGVFVITALEFKETMFWLSHYLQDSKVTAFQKTSALETMFYVVAGCFLFSAVCVLVDIWRKR